MAFSATALQTILERIKSYVDSHSGGSSSFAGLSDVSLSNLSNGQVPKYNSTTHKWENANESGGGASSLNDLSDVTTSNETEGQTLRYDATSNTYSNALLAWGDISSKPFSTIGSGLSVSNNALKADFQYLITDTEPVSIDNGTIVFVYE